MAEHGEPADLLRRVFAGYATHPNFAAVLLLGLGCETNQIDSLVILTGPASTLRTSTIQEEGGTAPSIQKGIATVFEMLEEANKVTRTAVSASNLVMGLQCGGSDAYSGISANPALGAAVDILVRNGGTAILSETPEIYGAEHLLTRRSASPEVAQRLIERIHWWEEYTARHKGSIDNNPQPGNKTGGLTTILEKSLGAISKGGTTNLNEVYRYAEPIRQKGLVFMDSHWTGSQWSQCPLLHYRQRVRLRLQTHSLPQDCVEHRPLQPHVRRYGHQLRHHHRRHSNSAGGRSPDL
jgi:altronate hydrolase